MRILNVTNLINMFQLHGYDHFHKNDAKRYHCNILQF